MGVKELDALREAIDNAGLAVSNAIELARDVRQCLVDKKKLPEFPAELAEEIDDFIDELEELEHSAEVIDGRLDEVYPRD
jgi:predicted nuclease with TOPRIM domain